MSLLISICLGATAIVVVFLLAGIRFIPNNRIGIVEKRFGGESLQTGLIA